MTRLVIQCLLGVFVGLWWSTAASAACVERIADEVAQVPVERWGLPYQVLVASEDVPTLEARGFRETECSGELAGALRQLNYRNSLCEVVASSNFLVQQQIEKALGAPPAFLCSSAEKVLGPWGGEAEGQAERGEVRSRVIDGAAAIGVSPRASGWAQ